MISYAPAQGSGAWREPAKWQVSRGLERTDDSPSERRHWRDRGLKTWSVSGAPGKARGPGQAKEWARTPYGDWMDAEFVAKRTAELKAAVKAQATQEAADASR